MSVVTLDRVRGMFMGAFLGDALGAPHEFNRKVPYTGLLEHETVMHTQFQGTKRAAVGQVTDDSEMTLALLRQLIRDKGVYNKDAVTIAYLNWANSGGWMMGTNTRAVLKGVTTLKGYQGRMKKLMATGPTQSNGAMMRCSPLALLKDYDCVIQDADITNPTDVVRDCNLIYVTALRLALQGYGGSTIFATIKGSAQTPEVRAVLEQVDRRDARDIVHTPGIKKSTKGWCLHALWCTMMTITSFNNYSDAMNWIITSQPGSDTDTNACIAGALLGAILGFDGLKKEEKTSVNIERLLTVDVANGPTPRPKEYTPFDFYTLTEAAHALTL